LDRLREVLGASEAAGHRPEPRHLRQAAGGITHTSMSATQVVIIGGGVIGCSVAYHLTASGVRDVVLLERGTLASGVTGICPGGIRQQFEGEADCRLAQRSLRFYERINDILQPDSPFFFERSGYLFLAFSTAVLDKYRHNVAMQNRLGIP